MKTWTYLGAGCALAGLLAACSGDGQAPQEEASFSAADDCTALLQADASTFPDPTLEIVSAEFHEAGPLSLPGPAPGVGGVSVSLPAHCEVTGKLQEREATDGMTYAIKFRMRLPADWNGRFLYEGSGGSNGSVSQALGNTPGSRTPALTLGYAVINDDSGHDNMANNDPARQGALAFGHDFEARRNYGYAAYDDVAKTAKALIANYYGRGAERSYFAGCSNGGREGMVFAQRYPEIFDGIIAAAPGFSLPKVGIAHAWDTQAFAEAARALDEVDPATGQPRIRRAFSDEDLALVSGSILAACDGLDGLEDGIVSAYGQCTPARVESALSGHICAGEKMEGCLIPEQVNALKAVFNGARNSDGELLYATFPWDPGIGGEINGAYDQGWRVWELGGYEGMPPAGLIVMLGAPSLSAVFTTPPTPMPADPATNLDYLLNFDFDADAPAIFATSEDFPESGWDLIAARSPDLSAFRASGGKIIVPHGVSDPVFSVDDTAQWWDEVDEREGGDASSFARVFPVPGMTHCSGGAATDQFDALAALVTWVEEGEAPDRIEASAGDNTPWPGRTRPLCPYPQIARYDGTGDAESAASFTCE